ncbi:MAG TPA: GAF domain-containing sensor histidine kinase [Polyangiaceae bacterium]|nr:GAF domain-containing sensor histidine kinase [Polyangiaceae bacterium]
MSAKSDPVRTLRPVVSASRRGPGRDGAGASATARDARMARVPRNERALEVALAREMRVSKALRDVGVALGTTLDLDELLELILEKITEALEADRTTLYLLDEANDELVSQIAQGSEMRAIRLKIGHGIAGQVARTGKPLHVQNAYEDPRFNPEWDLLSGYRTRSILAAPMKNHLGRTIGVVQVLNKTRGDFTEDDADILAALATQAAVSIDNSRLFMSVTQKNIQLLDTKVQLEHRVRDLKLLFDLEHAMGRAASLEELFLAVLGEAMRACEAKMGAVALRDRDTGAGALYVIDERARKMKRFPYPEDAGLIGWATRNNEVLVSSDAESDPRRDRAFDQRVGGAAAKTAIAVPLEGEHIAPSGAPASIGAIALYNKRRGSPFSEEDRGLLQLITANASTAIRLQLSREAREREERLTTIGRLLSSVIHDLKTPLSVIGGYVQMMQASNVPKERAKFAQMVFQQFDHIGAMQREVLEFARGEKSMLTRKVYVQKFFEDVRAQLEPDLHRRGVELVVDIQDRGTARFDEGKMLRVIHNLARNAAEAMEATKPTGGKFVIKVTRDKEDNALVISFSDTGPGIPKHIEHRLFQSFVTAGKKGGTGLGLAIVRKIADEHGGTVSVQSSTRGATFTLRLPQPAK